MKTWRSSAKRTPEAQRLYEKRRDIAALRDAAHRHAALYEPFGKFGGVDIDRIHHPVFGRFVA